MKNRVVVIPCCWIRGIDVVRLIRSIQDRRDILGEAGVVASMIAMAWAWLKI